MPREMYCYFVEIWAMVCKSIRFSQRKYLHRRRFHRKQGKKCPDTILGKAKCVLKWDAYISRRVAHLRRIEDSPSFASFCTSTMQVSIAHHYTSYIWKHNRNTMHTICRLRCTLSRETTGQTCFHSSHTVPFIPSII